MFEIIGFTILGGVVLVTGFYTLKVLEAAKRYEALFRDSHKIGWLSGYAQVMAGYYTAAIFLGATCLISLAILILK